MLPVPEHVAVIMDGNRRWAKERDLPVGKGHEKGREVIENVLDAALDLGIKHISLWALSLDNMVKRSQKEVKDLMDLFEKSFLDLAEDERIYENNVKVNVLGRWKTMLPERVVSAIQEAVEKTRDHSDHFLNLLISYSGKDEMLRAIKQIVNEKTGEGNPEVTPDLLKEKLFTSDLPPVDLMIRTGGEPHNSTGFMMWDMADSQYYFSEKFWPDFSGEDFKQAVKNYRNRDRRYGE